MFAIDPSNADEFFSKLGKVMALPRETITILNTNFPRQVKAANHWRAQIDAAFNNQNLGGQLSTLISHIDHNTVNQLSLTADLIESRISSKIVSDQELNAILADFGELIKAIDESDLSSSLKNYLTRELTDLQFHIKDYGVSGALPILKQAESMMGHVLVDPEYKSFLTNHDLGKRLLENLNAAAALLTIALQLPQLGTIFSVFIK
ncbi:hypothetical protein GO003_024820 [Methylicorpusculum oleiharenae]|uniref:hypothetical protein n=1 Tax=Methylicorpusculum oleiharenae TaxID=1338687 RepID=UPI00135B7FD3|nr:hypothetical protein [Methylicorpusculum oleiharenae]MCD2453605.1 hypothetical protein [Methylicorpusculum oleiharenae]